MHRRKDGYVGHERSLEHIVVAERALGHSLPPGAIVHHVNGNKADNRPENLVICPDDAYHLLIHQRMRAMDACGNPNWRSCHYCHTYDAPENMYILGRQSRHRACFNAAWNAKYHERKANKTMQNVRPARETRLPNEF